MWPEQAEAALSNDTQQASSGAVALFRDVIEPMADVFDPALCEPYAGLFARILERAVPGMRAAELIERYRRVRQPKRYGASGRGVRDVIVLSRVTLGADVAVTSVMLDGAKKRFPEARIHFAGPAKNYEMFAADRRVRHLDVPYNRGGLLRERIAAGLALGDVLRRRGGVVIDPDSRLTQLGVLPVCDEQNYFFWESRGYGGEGSEPLPELAQRWITETFGILDAEPYIRCQQRNSLPGPPPLVTVSFGVGENAAKRVPDPFETDLLRHLASTGLPVLVDEGAGGEESDRVRHAVDATGSDHVRTFRGPFADFAAYIARGRLYVGYDSAGQHVAAACGIPLAAVFNGFANERMVARWRPSGRGPVEVIRADRGGVFDRTVEAITRLLRTQSA